MLDIGSRFATLVDNKRLIVPTFERKHRKEKDMLNKIRNRKGFTLIELLIVVAIIGILAAVAIPQFSAYRIKGFNSAATSDLRNFKTQLESSFADNQVYPFY